MTLRCIRVFQGCNTELGGEILDSLSSEVLYKTRAHSAGIG